MTPASADGVSLSRGRSVAPLALTVVALGLMMPVGFAYLSTGLVASGADLLGAYALFVVLLTATVWLAVRRSWWVVAMPFVSAGFFVLMLWLGERFLDWSG